MNKFILLLRILAAGILLQTLFFKFTGAEESIFIFETLGAEPFGRWASGVIELIAAALLLIPTTQAIGAVLSMGVMAGAIMSHIVFLGIEVKGDGGLLFALALTVFVASAIVALVRRNDLITYLPTKLRRGP
jgi:putative oxidoreductase